MIELYTETLRDPENRALVFLDDVSAELMTQRKEAIKRAKGTREWVIVTDVIGGSEWLDETLGTYGVDVIEVNNLTEAEAKLRQLAHPQPKRVSGM